ncbi:Ribosomal large subunit pseudouridine synthase B, putative [Perkinsus marinus ATCC 50983]|uniref:Ribosomal large subunit pseudouridine synthase B, putative n=1 Tax=Perkinsus marinus (strain ATCC 50983 / TXsc) TaxID=423536 RepID=C5KUW6_PERM5|nr:Ribosomal large subunit pseudouridine synthase B, putative [Perkinsus marinus ATCC 50983]EER11681.1 Ribosomal large subunit pseudouridine synthase B, putative [Perkinsus marinus ATCC 50983]|eukprot:XP_002779886.1 Ribosomal large subunit pseudouridine synthase B, putative [Perkinsus marinus ATCC 50983]
MSPSLDIDQCLSDGSIHASPCLFAFFKPRGMETTCTAGSGLRKFLDRGRLHPVGRLDRDTTGLLLLSSDGDCTNRILHSTINKTYAALVRGVLPEGLMKKVVSEGVDLPDGHVDVTRLETINDGDTVPFGLVAYPLSSIPTNGCSMVRITTTCGRNRVVRRTLCALGHPVLLLHREEIGGIK